MNGKNYNLVELDVGTNCDATISLYRNNTTFDCVLTFLKVPRNTQHNELRTMSTLDEIKSFTKDWSIYSVKSSEVEWGRYVEGIYITTSVHKSSISPNFLLLEVLNKQF